MLQIPTNWMKRTVLLQNRKEGKDENRRFSLRIV